VSKTVSRKNRPVAIVGVGQTRHSSHREDVNQPELLHEAVRAALDDAGLTLDDIDAVVTGNMEMFEGIHQPDMWQVLGNGAWGKPCLRVSTGGTTGATVVCAADNLVASGLHDVVLAIGLEKQQEGHTTGGITAMADPLWGRHLQTGALTGMAASEVINEFGADRARRAAMKYRVIMDRHAARNANAHRCFHLSFDMIDDQMKKSPPLVGELRLIHMCSQSDGAAAMIFASRERAQSTRRPPVWVEDHVTVHREETMAIDGVRTRGVGGRVEVTTQRYAAEKLFARNGITQPREQIDVFEMYDPSAWWGVSWIRDFLMLEGDEHLKMVEQGDIEIEGSFPINPSGGVTATNPIGATAMLRPLEATLQVRGDAGDHQVPKPVNKALASGFGGTLWTVLMLLSKEIPE
jgi:acetyl-CoA C-acetyltransferase